MLQYLQAPYHGASWLLQEPHAESQAGILPHLERCKAVLPASGMCMLMVVLRLR